MPPTSLNRIEIDPERDLSETRPAEGVSLARWRMTGAMIKVVELRLRFFVLIAGTGLVFGYWDTLANRCEKWRRPPGEIHMAWDPFEFFCPMHPSVILATSEQCPICGMPLSRRVRGGTSAMPEGVMSQVRLTPGQVAQAGVRTIVVGFTRRHEQFTTVGYVGFDQGRYFQVASNARGLLRVDRVHAGSEGAAVQVGQPLAELTGYDVSQAIRLYLEAISEPRSSPETSSGPRPVPLGDPEERVRLAAEGLRVLGVRQDQIDAIAGGNRSSGLLPLLAPVSGHVIRKAVHEGQYVSEGSVLFEIADLSRVRVTAHVFEEQLGFVKIGHSIEATVPAFPGEIFAGRVSLIAPVLDPATRTAAVSFELENPGDRLRPGMFATVSLSPVPDPRVSRSGEQTSCPVTGLRLGSMGSPLQVEVVGRIVSVCCSGCVPKLKCDPTSFLASLDAPPADGVLTVPEAAVIDTGSCKVVYVEVCPGVFEGRSVTLGPRAGADYPVLAGLVLGQRVAASGAFLIDAESRLNAAPRDATGSRREAPGRRSQGPGQADGSTDGPRP